MSRKTIRLYLCIIICIISSNMQAFAYNKADEQHWYLKYNKNGEIPATPDNGKYTEMYDVISIDKSGDKNIYLTFDAGYENGNVSKILDVLKNNNVPAAFFVLPNIIRTSSETVRRMANEGHLICNHTKSHANMARIYNYSEFCKELSDNEKILDECLGLKMSKYYRPPEGTFSEVNLEFAKNCGYKTVFWSLAYADWDNNKQPSPEKALSLLTSRVHPGCVLLLHPNSDTNTKILDTFIKTLKNEGYSFKSLNDFPIR